MIDPKDIAVVVYDNLPAACDSIRENLCDLTRFKFGGQHNLAVFDTVDITKTLTELSGRFAWAVVAAAGTTIREQSQALETVEHAINTNSPLACHILDRNDYFHFHPQWFAVNLAAYREVGYPELEERPGRITLKTKTTRRSPDNVHDDYTPWWLHSSDEPAEYTCDYLGFGVKLIAELINAGYNITNVPQSVRQRKNYCYPEYNAEGIKRIIDDPAFVPEDSKSPLFWFHHEVSEMKRSLEIGYYVLNTEPLNNERQFHGRKFDCFAGVASGLKPACIVGQDNFADDSEVILFDISPAAIKWQQHLLSVWDGNLDTLGTVLQKFQQDNPDLRPIYYQHQSWDEIVAWFFSLTDLDAVEFKRRWDRYRNMNVKFININFLYDQQPIIDAVNRAHQGAYLWTSNLFNMDYLSFYKTVKWTNRTLETFTDKLKTGVSAPVAFENCNLVKYFNFV